MLLSLLGGMAKRGMQLNDERRAIDQQVELTRKLEDIKDEYAQRRAARASAAKAKANAKKYMGMLMPLVGGDEELAKKIYTQYQDGTADIIASGLALQAMGVPFIKDGTVNPVVNLPDVDTQEAMHQNLAINGNPSQKETSSAFLNQLAEIKRIGSNTNQFDPTLAKKIHGLIKGDIETAASLSQELTSNKAVSLEGGMLKIDNAEIYSQWLQQNGPAIVQRNLELFNIPGSFYELYLAPYYPLQRPIPNNNDDFEDGMEVSESDNF